MYINSTHIEGVLEDEWVFKATICQLSYTLVTWKQNDSYISYLLQGGVVTHSGSLSSSTNIALSVKWYISKMKSVVHKYTRYLLVLFELLMLILSSSSLDIMLRLYTFITTMYIQNNIIHTIHRQLLVWQTWIWQQSGDEDNQWHFEIKINTANKCHIRIDTHLAELLTDFMSSSDESSTALDLEVARPWRSLIHNQGISLRI